MLNCGHPVYVYNEVRPEGPTRVAFIGSVPPGTSGEFLTRGNL